MEPISLGKHYCRPARLTATNDVAQIFGPALAVAANMTTDATATTLTDGVETTWNVESLRRVAAVDRALSNSYEALRAWATKNAESTTAPDDADFSKAWTRFEEARDASNERLRGVALAYAATAFEGAAERSTAERRLTARFGAIAASLFMGDLTNGLSSLEELASNGAEFGEERERAFFELRDALARWSGRPSIFSFLRDCAERFKAWEPSGSDVLAGIAERVRAFELALTTELLATDWTLGREAFLKASSRCEGRLAEEASSICVRAFGQKRVAEPQAGERKVLTIKGVDFAFRWCPSGTFMMGSPWSEAERCDVEMRHEVALTKGFWMLETSVTQGQYGAIAGSNPSHFKSGDNYPVENVSWFDSQSFCDSLNALGVAPAGFAFRLPTEAEWEYACRAGTATPYFWGSTLNGDKANCDGNYPYGGVSKGRYWDKTSSVGSYTPNGWGLYDMHGNVWDWCADWFGAYSAGSQTEPTGPSSGSCRVLRGGGWFNRAKNCRSAYRRANDPTYRCNSFGFRLVLGR